MKRYSEYKDSGVAWIGEIPSHWEVKKIKYLVSEIISGGTPDTNNIDYWDFEKNSGVPWVAINDMSKSDFIKDSTAYITINGVKSKRLKIIPKGSLIYSIYATIGKVSELCIDATINQALLGLIVDENIIDKKYMKFSLNAIEKSISSLGSLNTQNNLNLEKVRNIELSIPSLKEQKKIASYLDKKISQIETFISKKEELIETLKASRTKLISETVTKGLDKNVPMKDSGVEWIGDIPSHWNISKLKYNLDTTKGYAFKADLFGDEGVSVVKASDIKNKTIVESDNYISYNIANKYKSVMLLEGDIIMSTVGSTPDVKNSAVGQLAYIPKHVEGSLLNQNTVILRINHNNLLYKRFLFYMLCSNTFRKYLDLYAHGTANQASLSLVDILNYDIAIPNKEEQYKIVDYLDKKISSIDMLISKTDEQIDILKKAKQKLITEVVTGKIDVTNL